MATGTRSGALRRYLNNASPSWTLGRELARSQVNYTSLGWRTVWQLDRRPGATERQVICYVLTEPSDSGGRGLSLREVGDLIGISHETVREHRDKAAHFLTTREPGPELGRAMAALARLERPLPTLLPYGRDGDYEFQYPRGHGWPAELWRLTPEEYWEMNRGGAIPDKYLPVHPIRRWPGLYSGPRRPPESFDELARSDHPALLEWKRRYWRKRYPPRRRPGEAPGFPPLLGSLTRAPAHVAELIAVGS